MQVNNFSGKPGFQFTMIILILGILLSFYCHKIIFNPGEHVFHGHSDGLKNYYTLSQYVEDTSNNDKLLMFKGFNYPFGEVVYFTDNSPLISVPLKLFNQHVFNTKGYTTYLFDLFSLFMIILAGIIFWLILRRITDDPVLLIGLSVMLPILSPQILRFYPGGTLNLSYSVVFLFPIYLIQSIVIKELSNKRYIIELFALSACIFLPAFLHIYYIVILELLIVPLLFIAGIYLLLKGKPWLKFCIRASCAALLPFICFWLILLLTDPFLNERNSTAMGYNWEPWKLRVSSLFTEYPYLKNSFIFAKHESLSAESHVYLGSFALYLLIILPFFWIGNMIWKRKFYAINLNSVPGIFVIMILFASLVTFFISIGPTYQYGMGESDVLVNRLNLFYYAEQYSQKIQHFRCLGRFAWPFFWSFNLTIIYLLAKTLNDRNRWYRMVVYLLLLISFKDTLDTLQYIRSMQVPNPLLCKGEMEPMQHLINCIDVTRYQAVLPLPFYHAGSEDTELTIDAQQMYFVKTVSFAYQANLPLMASTMSRTSLKQTAALFSLINEDKADDALLSKLNEKPILVFVDKSFYGDSTLYTDFRYQNQRNTFYQSRSMIEKYQMKQLTEYETYELYELPVNAVRNGKIGI